MVKHKIICGKAEEVLRGFEDNTFDSGAMDPPYGLEFMGRDWDKFKEVGHWDGNRGYESHKDAYGRIQGKCPAKYKTSGNNLDFQQFTYQWATELYRVMKPGAHILVFGGTRTYHRMACAVEDSGFECRDMISWNYGSGFPKSLNISKELDKKRRGDFEQVRNILREKLKRYGRQDLADKLNVTVRQIDHWVKQNENQPQIPSIEKWNLIKTFVGIPEKDELKWMDAQITEYNYEILGIKKRDTGNRQIPILQGDTEVLLTSPKSEEAIQWNGWGTGLKPAHEPILLARKPISERNIAANVLKWGVGGLNIDECRMPFESGGCIATNPLLRKNCGAKIICGGDKSPTSFKVRDEPEEMHINEQGRFSANLILDEEAGRMLDEQSGELTTGEMNSTAKGGQYATYGYQYPRKTISHKSKRGASRFFYQAKASQAERWFYCTICKQAFPMIKRDAHTHNAPKEAKYKYLEFHPTQKPEDLICYLMRLITPPNGTTIDPFLGSGTAIIAAEREGFNCVGIDSKPEYCEMCYARGKGELAQQKISTEQSTIEKVGF